MELNRFLTILVAAAILIYVVYIIYYLFYAKKLDALTAILSNEDDPDKYIREVNNLLEKRKAPQLKNIRLVNIAIAYEAKRDFKKADEMLKQVKPTHLTLANRAVYYLNKAYTDFYLDNWDDACALMDKNKREFENLSGFEEHKAKVAIVSVFYNIATHNKKMAREIFTKSRLKWNETSYAKDFAYLEKQLNRKR